MQDTDESERRVVKPAMFCNWIDQYGFPVAEKFLPFLSNFKFITPNVITVLGFLLYTLASISLFLPYRGHLLLAGLLFPVAYLADQVDGQLARLKNLTSKIGDYLDKTLDVLKTFVIFFSLGLASYVRTGNIGYLLLAFIACFFFNYRYYIKLETVLAESIRDGEYLKKCADIQDEYERKKIKEYANLGKTFWGRIKLLINKNKTIVVVDEGEFAIFTAAAALLNQLELVIWIFAISQMIIAFVRLWQRGYQVQVGSQELYKPMRK